MFVFTRLKVAITPFELSHTYTYTHAYIDTMNIYAREKLYKILTFTCKFNVFESITWVGFLTQFLFLPNEVCKTCDR